MSEPDVRLILPVPPSANALFTYRAHSRQRIKTDAYRLWIKDAGWALIGATSHIGHPRGWKHVRIEYGLPFNYRRDISNGIKAIEDLIVAHGIIKDDRWVDELHVRRVPVTEALTVSIWRLDAKP